METDLARHGQRPGTGDHKRGHLGTGPLRTSRLGGTLLPAQRVRQAESSGLFRIPGEEMPGQRGAWWLLYTPVKEEKSSHQAQRGLAFHGNRRCTGIILFRKENGHGVAKDRHPEGEAGAISPTAPDPQTLSSARCRPRTSRPRGGRLRSESSARRSKPLWKPPD